MTGQKTALRKLNMMNAHGFARVIGPAFEHAPWVAERAFALHPFKDRSDLHEKLCQTLHAASDEEKLSLIGAHPDLMEQSTGGASAATTQAVASRPAAGLDRLSAAEVEMFQAYNDAYRDQFGFPFIICARENRKDAILSAFPRRLKNAREKEIATALTEICKIAELCLADTVEG